MENPSEIRAMTREEITEAFGIISETRELLGSMPHKDAKLVELNLKCLTEIFEEVFPGGYLSRCEVCLAPFGADEIGGHDSENSVYFCRECAADLKEASNA